MSKSIMVILPHTVLESNMNQELGKAMARFYKKLEMKAERLLLSRKELTKEARDVLQSMMDNDYAEYSADPETFEQLHPLRAYFVRDRLPELHKSSDATVRDWLAKSKYWEDSYSNGEIYTRRNPQGKWSQFHIGGHFAGKYLNVSKSGMGDDFIRVKDLKSIATPDAIVAKEGHWIDRYCYAAEKKGYTRADYTDEENEKMDHTLDVALHWRIQEAEQDDWLVMVYITE